MTADLQPVLDVRNIGKVWEDRGRRIDISISRLSLSKGELKVITGPSGSGKSTALDLIALALKPEPTGSLHLASSNGIVDACPLLANGNEDRLSEIRAELYGYIVQTAELIPFLSVQENCEIQQRICGRGSRRNIAELAKTLEIDDLLDNAPAELSVGQRQRAAIVRALCSEPRIVLADEPTSSQDPELKDLVISVLKSFAQNDCGVIVVTHDVDLVARHDLNRIEMQSEKRPDGWWTRFSDEGFAA